MLQIDDSQTYVGLTPSEDSKQEESFGKALALYEHTDFKLKCNTSDSKQLYFTVLTISEVSTLKLFAEPY